MDECCLTCEHCYDWDCAKNCWCGIHGSLLRVDREKYSCAAWTEKRKEQENDDRKKK